MKTHGMVAAFENPARLMEAARRTREAGYTRFDVYSPFPIHGMDAVMGEKRSPVGLIVGGMALVGAAVGFSLQTWVTTSAYPLVISGKPHFSWQAYIIITFALFVLFGAFSAVISMLRLNRLPRLHHPMFHSTLLERASDDGFLLAVEVDDARFDETATRDFFTSIGATDIELVRGE
ncbi:MAG: DUF3341 domain-containing protein [Bacteroidota bacterium]|jgi:hypothetical protein|nr:DUF3341 domain-containing protein [Bacteroidota bacterium]